jgi:hypothetical protein
MEPLWKQCVIYLATACETQIVITPLALLGGVFYSAGPLGEAAPLNGVSPTTSL